MIRVLSFALGVSAMAMPAFAQATEAQKAALAAAIEAADCRVTAENNSEILAAAGLDEEDATIVVQALLETGLAVIDNGALVMISDNCP